MRILTASVLAFSLLLSAGLVQATPDAVSDAAPAPASGMGSGAAPGATDWRWTLGAVALGGPRYAGARSRQSMLVPSVELRHSNGFFVHPAQGVGAERVLAEGLKGSAALALDFASRQAKDDARLQGLGDVSKLPAVRLALDWEPRQHLGLSAELMTRLGNAREDGSRLKAEAAYSLLATRAAVVAVGWQVQAMDARYARNFFGVSATQATASGLSAFDAGAGLHSTGPFVQVLKPLSGGWVFFGRAEYSRLQADAAASPVALTRHQTSWIASVARRF